jgi:hypothetical protein
LTEGVENRVMAHAVSAIVPGHVEEVRRRRLVEIDKVEREVTARLKKEINYWDHRAQDLKAQERAGRQTRLSSANAEARANDLSDRLQRRLAELARERDISALPPVIRGGAIVVPCGLLADAAPAPPDGCAEDTAAVEQAAMAAVVDAERALGFVARDVSAEHCGYDIESKDGAGALRFIEVKGRVSGADTVTVTRNEILTALNKPEGFILAVVAVEDGFAHEPRYVRRPFQREPDFGATSVTYKLADLLARGETPG